MGRKTSTLILRDGDYEYLRSLIKQRTIQAQVVIRAHILLDRSNGTGIRTIAQIYDISPATVQLCIKNILKAELVVLYSMISGKAVRLRSPMMLLHGL